MIHSIIVFIHILLSICIPVVALELANVVHTHEPRPEIMRKAVSRVMKRVAIGLSRLLELFDARKNLLV